MADYFACLEAKMIGGAFVHEQWRDLSDGHLVALCRSRYDAIEFAKTLARRDNAASGRVWIVTDARGSPQDKWTHERITDADAKLAEAA